MRTALAYRPRQAPLQLASPPAAIAYLGSLAFVAFVFSSPIVLAGAGAAVVVAGIAAGARPALAVAARFGLVLGLMIVLVNVIVTTRGETILLRGWDLPWLGETLITLESMAAGATIALRIVVVIAAFAVYSACVDPDRVLRLLRPIARRSALTATLVARAVPLAAADFGRLREATRLRGPAAAPATRATIARRLLVGALDRSVDAAATLELRGFGSPARSRAAPPRRSRHDRSFLATGVAIVALTATAALAGFGGFDPYPEVEIDADPATLGLSLALPLLAALPFALARGRAAPRARRRRIRSTPEVAGG
jgi:energy-coupling factor transport system permease protein